jgi:hypothetical protein
MTQPIAIARVSGAPAVHADRSTLDFARAETGAYFSRAMSARAQ